MRRVNGINQAEHYFIMACINHPAISESANLRRWVYRVRWWMDELNPEDRQILKTVYGSMVKDVPSTAFRRAETLVRVFCMENGLLNSIQPEKGAYRRKQKGE